MKVGIKKIAEVARRYGLGIEHDLGLEVEAAGLIPSKEWKKRTKGMDWLIGDTANASIGQGDVLTSPLQLAVMTARIATGKDIKPVLLNSNSNGGGQLPATDLEDDPARLKAVRQAMFNVSNKRNGTAYKSRLIKDKFRMAGKTARAKFLAFQKQSVKKVLPLMKIVSGIAAIMRFLSVMPPLTIPKLLSLLWLNMAVEDQKQRHPLHEISHCLRCLTANARLTPIP